jgi:hypothetical protein
MAVQFALLGLSEHTFFLSSMTPRRGEEEEAVRR